MTSIRSPDFYHSPDPEKKTTSKYDTLDLSTSSPAPPTSSSKSSNPTPPRFTLHPVLSETDVPSLATINDRALDADLGFKQWMAKFTERTEYSTTVEAVTGALGDPEYRLVKAVLVPDSEDGTQNGGEGKIVGFIHWFQGFIQLAKVDPFAEKGGEQQQQQQPKTESAGDEGKPAAGDVRDVTSNIAESLASKATRLEAEEHAKPEDDQEALIRARRLRKGEQKYIETRNHYIGAIRGKKHMFIRLIMVLPEYQGKGVGTRLMKVVTDEADRLGIVCWLFARPAGVKMYERFGYRTVGATEMSDKEEGLVCAETFSMMRLPRR